jgi:hypothetical protein
MLPVSFQSSIAGAATMPNERKDVTLSMTADDLQFLIWAMKALEEGGPQEVREQRDIVRWEAIFVQTLGKYFDELPGYAMPDLDEEK